MNHPDTSRSQSRRAGRHAVSGPDPVDVAGPAVLEQASLEQVVGRLGPMTPQHVAAVGLAVLDQLVAVHNRGMLHGDVRPGSVLLGPRDRITLAAPTLRSPAFTAPEGVTGPAADLWSLGATLYTAVEGRPPSPGGSLDNAGPIGPVLFAMLSGDPARRPDPGSLRNILLDLSRSGAVHTPLPPVRADAVPPPSPWAASAPFPSDLPPVPPLSSHSPELPPAFPAPVPAAPLSPPPSPGPTGYRDDHPETTIAVPRPYEPEATTPPPPFAAEGAAFAPHPREPEATAPAPPFAPEATPFAAPFAPEATPLSAPFSPESASLAPPFAAETATPVPPFLPEPVPPAASFAPEAAPPAPPFEPESSVPTSPFPNLEAAPPASPPPTPFQPEAKPPVSPPAPFQAEAAPPAAPPFAPETITPASPDSREWAPQASPAPAAPAVPVPVPGPATDPGPSPGDLPPGPAPVSASRELVPVSVARAGEPSPPPGPSESTERSSDRRRGVFVPRSIVGLTGGLFLAMAVTIGVLVAPMLGGSGEGENAQGAESAGGNARFAAAPRACGLLDDKQADEVVPGFRSSEVEFSACDWLNQHDWRKPNPEKFDLRVRLVAQKQDASGIERAKQYLAGKRKDFVDNGKFASPKPSPPQDLKGVGEEAFTRGAYDAINIYNGSYKVTVVFRVSNLIAEVEYERGGVKDDSDGKISEGAVKVARWLTASLKSNG